MKKCFLSAFLWVVFNYCSFSQNNDTTLNYLSNLNLDSYKNKPVDSFLIKIPNNYIELKNLPADNPKIAAILSVLYSNKVFVWIYVYHFQFMNPRSETMTWDMSLFRKENIDHIEVWQGWDCYNGCPDDAPSVAKPARGNN